MPPGLRRLPACLPAYPGGKTQSLSLEDCASLSHVTLGFSKEDGDLGIGFLESFPLHMLVCHAGLQRGSSHVEGGSATILSLGKLE